ncbi:MAG: EamA/RhaT family transporter [Thalassospira sp.]|uniref:DMT family transporter n=1 Tax=unclassified Thalassospira TaxID=2648997 RepID=UPI0007A5BEDA|nr:MULTISPECIES: DMT family transporter [unclassified Thalassospira]KZD02465.1 RNA polymerase subunit sigma-54 [Thalassospira sp. MCCC 1A02898]MBE71180.1 EamA/RhaT family transporter [Thalassospira sp.]ONH88967.1 RNA polymerase subunit sigma-54 [Thalassospira sp. MCCC 1A02803]|tara:strand:- start:683 stop:1564 length:882 start_codon:yes stop_codon:yes gene_type:complete
MRTWFNTQSDVMRASFFALFAAILAACFTLTIRYATEELHPYQAVFLRFAFGLILILPMVLKRGIGSLATKRLPLFGLRGVLSAAEMCLWFMAVLYLPLAEATTLNFTVPLFGTILAAVILREQVRIHRWLAIVIGFVGVALIIQPGTDTMQAASILPIAAAICMASAGLITKRLVATESTTSLLFYLMIITTPVSLIPALFVWQTPSWSALGLMAVAALMMNVMQVCNVKALQLADYSFFVGFSYLRLPIIAVLALILFDEVPDIWILPGGAMIIGAAIYVALRERKLAKAR